MGFLGRAIKGGLAMKAAELVKREAQKRANQRKVGGRPAKVKTRGR